MLCLPVGHILYLSSTFRTGICLHWLCIPAWIPKAQYWFASYLVLSAFVNTGLSLKVHFPGFTLLEEQYSFHVLKKNHPNQSCSFKVLELCYILHKSSALWTFWWSFYFISEISQWVFWSTLKCFTEGQCHCHITTSKLIRALTIFEKPTALKSSKKQLITCDNWQFTLTYLSHA